MITINNANDVRGDIQLKDIIGFAVDMGYFLIDQESNYLVSFWIDDITCSVTNLLKNGIDMNSTLSDLVTALNICKVYDVTKVFTDVSDFKIDLTW